jgi:hypothetical protein
MLVKLIRLESKDALCADDPADLRVEDLLALRRKPLAAGGSLKIVTPPRCWSRPRPRRP